MSQNAKLNGAAEGRHWPLIAAWLLFAVVFVGWLAVKYDSVQKRKAVPVSEEIPKELPIYGSVPETTLIDSSGESFSTASLEGKVWAVSLIFTYCAASCPRMTSQFAVFQNQVEHPDVRLVTISVDPERDTPERLREYARLAGADPARWIFLTGDLGTIIDLAENHLKIGTGQSMEGVSSHPTDSTGEASIKPYVDEFLEEEWSGIETPPKMTDEAVIGDHAILHSDRFVLVDREGRIRGYYPGLEDEGLKNLKRDALRLAEE